MAKKTKLPPAPIELAITEWGEDFEGIGEFQKPNGPLRKLHVPCTMPGDVIQGCIRSPSKGRHQAHLEHIIAPSSKRITARCPHFGTCGGCRLQHVAQEDQLSLKEGKVRGLLTPLADPATAFASIQPAESMWEYRNKMEFSFSTDAGGQHYLGLMGLQGRGRVINLDVCFLSPPWMVQTLHMMKDWRQAHVLTSYHPCRNTGCLRTLTLRHGFASGDRLAMLTVSGNPEDALCQKAMKDWVARMQELCAVDMPSAAKLSCFIRIQQVSKGAPTQFYEMLLHGPGEIRETLTVQAKQDQPAHDLNFHIGPTSFFQPNPKQAEKLYSLALQMAQLTPETTVYDLCCGTATLGIAAARFVKRVIGVELSPEALIDAKTNVKLNGYQNVSFHQGDVGAVSMQLAGEALTPGERRVVIVDPPRAGLPDAAHRAIIALSPEQIVSISCNPVSQARDISALKQAGYRLVKVQPVECFPHTPHIENIALLERAL